LDVLQPGTGAGSCSSVSGMPLVSSARPATVTPPVPIAVGPTADRSAGGEMAGWPHAAARAARPPGLAELVEVLLRPVAQRQRVAGLGRVLRRDSLRARV